MSLPAEGLEEPSTFLRIRDVFKFADLEFSVLLNESNPTDRIVLNYSTVGKSEQGRPLRRGSALILNDIYL